MAISLVPLSERRRFLDEIEGEIISVREIYERIKSPEPRPINEPPTVIYYRDWRDIMTEEERQEAGFGGDNFRWATAGGRLYRKAPEGLRDVTDEAQPWPELEQASSD